MIPAVLIPQTPHAEIKALVGIVTLPQGEVYLTTDGWHYVTVVTGPAGVKSLWIIYSSSMNSRHDIQVAIQVAQAAGATRLIIEVPVARIPYYNRLGFTQAAGYPYGVMEMPTGALGNMGGPQ